MVESPVFCSTEWFQKQQEFTNAIENLKVDELNKCLAKFYVSVRKTGGSYYKKTSLLSIRATLDRDLSKMSLFHFIFLNNHQCNYTKTISRLRRRECAANSHLDHVDFVSATCWLFTDIHVETSKRVDNVWTRCFPYFLRKRSFKNRQNPWVDFFWGKKRLRMIQDGIFFIYCCWVLCSMDCLQLPYRLFA